MGGRLDLRRGVNSVLRGKRDDLVSKFRFFFLRVSFRTVGLVLEKWVHRSAREEEEGGLLLNGKW